MGQRIQRGTLLNIPLVEERYGRSFLASIGIHLGIVVLILAAPYLLPRLSPIVLGTGPGGGSGGDTISVGLADELAGGIGMIKPPLIPQPPLLPAEKAEPEKPKQEAIPLPQTVEPRKTSVKKAEEKAYVAAKEKAPTPGANIIPTAPSPGAGGTGGMAGGAGGGRGGGVGIAIGAGTGGFGDLWYARVVESRIGSNWIKPSVLGRVEIIYSFFITNEGNIRDVKKEKSCGNEILDLTAERAIRASTPLPPLPPELRGREVQFVAQFIYPPNP